MPDNLTDDDKAILAALLRETAHDRFPLSPRVRGLRAIVEEPGRSGFGL